MNALLKETLDRFREAYPWRERLAHDPVRFPRRYDEPADQEVVALVSALFAYGRVASLLVKIGQVLEVLGPHPGRSVRGSAPQETLRALRGWTHRWNRPEDVAYLVEGMRRLLERHGSLGAAFTAGYRPEDADLRPALSRFVAELRSVDPEPIYGHRRETVGRKYMLASPDQGSPLKRWNLFLRWMVRPEDGIDLGLWREIPPSKLTIPLDTHTFRIGRALRLTRLRTPRWEAARQITGRLAELDPDDPVKYDFAICHLGISGACKGYRVPAICGACGLNAICRLPARRSRRGRKAARKAPGR